MMPVIKGYTRAPAYTMRRQATRVPIITYRKATYTELEDILSYLPHGHLDDRGLIGTTFSTSLAPSKGIVRLK